MNKTQVSKQVLWTLWTQCKFGEGLVETMEGVRTSAYCPHKYFAKKWVLLTDCIVRIVPANTTKQERTMHRPQTLQQLTLLEFNSKKKKKIKKKNKKKELNLFLLKALIVTGWNKKNMPLAKEQ